MQKQDKSPNYEVLPSVDFDVNITGEELLEAIAQSIFVRRIMPLVLLIGMIGFIMR